MLHTAAFGCHREAEDDIDAQQPEQRKRRRVANDGDVLGRQHVRRPETPRRSRKIAAGPQHVPNHLRNLNQRPGPRAERIRVETRGPACAHACGQFDDALVLPVVDDAMNGAAALAHDAQHFERHALETRDDHHAAATRDHASRLGRFGDHGLAGGDKTDRGSGVVVARRSRPTGVGTC